MALVHKSVGGYKAVQR